MTTTAELIPMASPTFESGPPRPPAIELARVVDRGIRETKTIDVEKLCITPGEKVWVVFIDMHVLDYDGNLFDACSYGAMAALKSTTLSGSMLDPPTEDFPLPVNHVPVSVTNAKIGNKVIVDPRLDEELIADARLTVVTDENGDVRAMQKGLNGSFSFDEIQQAIETSRAAGKKLREIILQ
jgi:exosome complex component RRP42